MFKFVALNIAIVGSMVRVYHSNNENIVSNGLIILLVVYIY